MMCLPILLLFFFVSSSAFINSPVFNVANIAMKLVEEVVKAFQTHDVDTVLKMFNCTKSEDQSIIKSFMGGSEENKFKFESAKMVKNDRLLIRGFTEGRYKPHTIHVDWLLKPSNDSSSGWVGESVRIEEKKD